MKLIRFGNKGNEKPGVIVDDKMLDVSPYIKDYDENFFLEKGIMQLKEILASRKLDAVAGGVRLGAPLKRPSKIICVGLNYADHARETGAKAPKEPIIFFKSTTSLSGPGDQIIIPKGSSKTDWEVELAVVIGRKAAYIGEEEASDYILGYCLHNDVSEREYQIERGGQWVKGKSCDTFGPLGPWIITPDAVPDINNLRLWLDVNGKRMQDGNTSNLIFKIPFLVSYISRFMTLLPGDIISTGTPAGVGLGFDPPVYLRDGDIVELGGDFLGYQVQYVTKWERKYLNN